ncbi:hydrogenase [Mycobacterium conspicuum]|jgi:hydroxylaminobenzene mutase|uniref:Hydrogenase n=1 Tax=Mycobacterium conspicuum TaxID=44010 RepID=A0A1X1TNG8_9MYCO|nr:hydrogenase [Mycobacterium conspicuum]ORV46110.1 hydrogenase [Mycobacterium conspicuum]BBZ37940.1 hydrogenase [Mycobacterium conspicuum]
MAATHDAHDRPMIWLGVFLFVIGLVTGTQERHFKNMRMGLSAHLEGVMNGMFLMALGAIWGEVNLPPSVQRTARWAMLYGTYGNWLFTSLGAVMGTAVANPILSQGHSGKPWQERVVGLGFRSMRNSLFVGLPLVLWGLIRRRAEARESVRESEDAAEQQKFR